MCRATFHDEIDQSQRFQEEDGDEEEKENGNGLPDEEEVRIVRRRMNELLQSVQSI